MPYTIRPRSKITKSLQKKTNLLLTNIVFIHVDPFFQHLQPDLECCIRKRTQQQVEVIRGHFLVIIHKGILILEVPFHCLTVKMNNVLKGFCYFAAGTDGDVASIRNVVEDDGDLWMKIRKAIKDCATNGNGEERVQKFWSLLGDLERNSAVNNNFNETMILKKLNELFEEVVNDENTWIKMKESILDLIPDMKCNTRSNLETKDLR